ncbi:MAG TPA: glycosyltransferase family 2 protein [Acidobacteriota bacterium]|nr:glycosyltransferase family 2 protein [Acidobacteriota bacterium]
MKETPSIAVIIPSYSSRPLIGATLRSLFLQDVEETFEVVVVDSSPDDTADWIRGEFPSVKVLHSPQRLLPGAARNRGVQATRARLLAFLDADATARPDWLKILLGRLRQDGIRAAGGSVDNANPESPVSRMLYWIEFSEFAPGLPSGPRWALPSCNFVIPRRDFERAGGFEEKTAMSEDQIFCLALGEGIFFESSTGVLHRQREALPQALDHLRRLGLWSGRLRRRFKVPGWRLRRFPAAAWLLLPLRAWRIWRRARRSRAPLKRGDLPLLGRGLTHWCRGFRQGLREI